MAELWVPDQVVDRHKRRAGAVWCVLLSSLVVYTTWSVITTVRMRKNPSVNLRIQNEPYQFPDVSICFEADTEEGIGCDSPETDCATTATILIRGSQGFSNVSTTDIASLNERFPSLCVDAKLSSVTVDPQYETDRQERKEVAPPEISLKVAWVTSHNDSEITVRQISKSVWVYLTDSNFEAAGDKSTVVGAVAYTRVPAGELAAEVYHTSVTMEMTESIDIFDHSARAYSAASISTTMIEDPMGDFSVSPSEFNTGLLLLDVYQPGLSWSIQEEVDPVQWTVIVGNIGGAWEILLIVWGILFVAARREGPTLKSRNFFKSARRGRERLVHEAGLLSEHIHGCGAGNRVGSNGGQSGALSAANPQISLPFSPFSEEENKIDHVGVEEEKGKQRELCLTGDAVPDTGKPGGGTVFGAPENTKPSCSEQTGLGTTTMVPRVVRSPGSQEMARLTGSRTSLPV